MNIIRKPSDAGPPPPPKDNPYRFGWRYLPRVDERGRQQYDMIPLTEEDILHPRLDDHVTQNQPHIVDFVYLFYTFKLVLRHRADALVLGDHLIKWDIPGMRGHGPDIAVVFGIQPNEVRPDSFDVAQHGVGPELIIEITSRSTRRNDLTVKPGHYWRCQVPYFVIVDQLPRQRQGQRQLRILGYQLGKRAYRQMRLNARGRLWLETVQLWLGHEDGRVVCYDKQGQPIADRQEEAQARLEAEQRAEQEAQARREAEQQLHQAMQQAEQAQSEVARLQQELRRLRGE
jgi:colicin import membrane protein